MPSIRSIPAGATANVFDDWSYFFKFTTGGVTYRYTDQARPGTGSGFTGNIDGTSQTWTERGLAVPNIEQNNAGLLSVQYVELDNLDYAFGNLANSPGLRGAAYELWFAYFSAITTIDGSPFRVAAGVIDDSTHKETSRITLKDTATHWAKLALGPPQGTLCPYIFKDTATCQYVGADTVCQKTRTDCVGRTGGSNVAHFGGEDLNPPAGTSVTWQYQVINPSTGPLPHVTNPADPTSANYNPFAFIAGPGGGGPPPGAWGGPPPGK